MSKVLPFLGVIALCVSCVPKTKVDLLVYNATIYTVDSTFSKAEAMVIKDGRIVDVGTNSALQEHYVATEKLDAGGKFIYPGFFDAHCHFFGYAGSLQTADLVGTRSWDEVLQVLNKFAASHAEGWLTGRGWDQNDWPVEEFPTNEKLNKLFPDRPVYLERVDGHAAIANAKALEVSGVNAGDTLEGGVVGVKDGRLTGILIDNATSLVAKNIPRPSNDQIQKALLEAQTNCFAVGLTTLDDCGLPFSSVDLVREMQDAGSLKMRMYIMLSDNPADFEYAQAHGKIKTDRLDVRAFKFYADGALGSRGACLLKTYSDEPDWHGFLLSPVDHFDSAANFVYNLGFQMCTHAIGDSANRTMLNIYAKYLQGKNDLRWRIEHAQVVNENDFELFGQYNIIPSVQPTHATSDMYWAGDRLGPERLKGAYAYQQLLKENGWEPLGTDFPVEDISPFKTFYAAVVRKDAKGFPPEGFQVENALTREQALRGMTIWAAKANFEENEKGSLEKGKFADFVILDGDLMKEPAEKLLQVKVMKTFLNGEMVYGR